MKLRRIRYPIMVFLTAIWMMAPLHASEKSLDCGTVSGNIHVWKTKVKTQGAKSTKDVLVYLEDSGERTYPPSAKQVVMDQKSLVFIPHVLPIQKGTTVKFLNSDQVDHNVYFLFENTGETLDIGTWGYGISKTYQFNDPGQVITLCKLHLEMAAHIIVLENPFFSMVEIEKDSQQAAYTIENVPPGAIHPENMA